MRNRNMSKGLKAILLSHYADIPMQNNATFLYVTCCQKRHFLRKTVIFFLSFCPVGLPLLYQKALKHGQTILASVS